MTTIHDIKKRIFRDRRVTRLIQATIVSLLVPLGWMLIQFATLPYFDAYVATNSGVFIYMGSVTLIAFSIFGWHAGLKENTIADISYKDPLTLNYNVRFLREELSRLLAYSKRNESPLSLILLDIDKFSEVNEKYGHEMGDVVLHNIGQILEQTVRESDMVARVSGDIFCIVMPSTDQEQSKHLVGRLQQRLAQSPQTFPDHEPFKVSCSYGVVSSTNTSHIDAHQFFKTADSALLYAQERGDNQLELRVL